MVLYDKLHIPIHSPSGRREARTQRVRRQVHLEAPLFETFAYMYFWNAQLLSVMSAWESFAEGVCPGVFCVAVARMAVPD